MKKYFAAAIAHLDLRHAVITSVNRDELPDGGAEIFGLESQGMIVMAENRQGKLAPLTADSEPGSTVS